MYEVVGFWKVNTAKAAKNRTRVVLISTINDAEKQKMNGVS
jgi:hypothetical protein